jgi:monofunctional glycosyltransferase
MAENGALSSIATKERRVPRRRRSSLWRALRRVFWAIAVVAALPLVLLPLYGTIDPPGGTVMLWKRLAGAPIEKHWADLADISPNLVRAVLASEDARFCSHNGIDFVELQNALDDEDGRFRGASTITMQTVKNLFLWTGRDWVRKAIEAPLALYADFVLPKRRIMEIYLNIVEWDTGVYGAAAAAEHYFGVPPAKLSATQAARLAAILPSPETRDAANPGPGTRRIAKRIAARAAQSAAYAACVLD